MSAPHDSWNPAQYDRFKAERSQPFHDLMALVESRPGMRVADLGCGTGELTALLHDRLRAASTEGSDSSAAMLAQAAAFVRPGLSFVQRDLRDVPTNGQLDLLLSNAAIQWVDDHPALLARFAAALAPGGQLAVQMPANFDHPSHQIAARVAREAPFAAVLEGYEGLRSVLPPEAYALRLKQLGFAQQQVRLHVYMHTLDNRAGILEWVKGTALTAFKSRLPEPLYAAFVQRYATVLAETVPEAQPFYYTFKRIILWAQR